MKYAFIVQQVGRYPVTLMCRVLGGFYAAQQRQPSRRAQADGELQAEIAAILDHSRQRYGSPRIHAELRAGSALWS